jgi:hypothetical protein
MILVIKKQLSCLVQLYAEPLDESQGVDRVPHVLLKLLLSHLHQVFLQPEAVFKEKSWVLDPTITSLFLIVDSEVSCPPQLQRERGWVEKVSLIGWAHLNQSANNGTNRKRDRKRKTEGRGGS